MSRVYWDTMLFIYWLEDREPFSKSLASMYRRMQERGDTLVTSAFAIAELMVGPEKRGDVGLAAQINAFFSDPKIEVLSFDRVAAKTYSQIRAKNKVSPADAIHLACASVARVDLFLTNDQAVRRLIVPGIQFIDGIETTVLGPDD